jgi:hypothetical protein
MTRIVASEPGKKFRRRRRILAGGGNVEARHFHEPGLIGRVAVSGTDNLFPKVFLLKRHTNPLDYLAPEIVGALLAGRHPIELTPASCCD